MGNAKVEQLVKELQEASAAYYNQGKSPLSDEEFDGKRELLRALDPDNAYFQAVGAPPPAVGATVKHTIPVGSQEKLANRAEFDRWCKLVLSMHSGKRAPFVLQHKLDGMTTVLSYKSGKLVSAVSRGDGRQGTDVTANVVKMDNVKRTLPVAFTGSLRGEVLLDKGLFERYFKASAGRAYKTPRNTVTGLTMNQNGDPLVKWFKVHYFDIVDESAFGMDFETEEERLGFIKSKLGLGVVDMRACADADELWKAYEELAARRDSLSWEIDGVVVRANLMEIQDKLGMDSDLCPKGQRCVKFKALGATSKILGVELTVGHTGAVIPTAVLEPCQIGGVTVSSALLNNFPYIEALGVAIGDQVEVVRRGDVIPHIEKLVAKGKDRKEIKAPTKCPACDGKLEMDGVRLLCKNEECPAQGLARVKTWVKKRDIKFVGPEVLEKLYETKRVLEPSDLYSLTRAELAKVPRGQGVVGSAADQMVDEIEKSKECTLSDFLGSLCIPLLGRRQVEIIMENKPPSGFLMWTLRDLCNLTADDLLKMPGFADTKAKAIADGLKKAAPQVSALLKAGVKVVAAPKPVAPATTKLAGMSFCFTGAIDKVDDKGERYTRQRMWDVVLRNGGKVSEDVRAGVSHLVQADVNSQSSKTKKAAKIGVKIISEAEFWKMVEKGGISCAT